MKTKVILTTLLLILCFQFSFSQSQFFESVSDEFHGEKDINRITLPGAIFQMIGSVESEDEDIEIFQFINQMNLITIPNDRLEKNNLSFKRLLKKAKNDDFDEYLSVTEEKSLIRLYVKEDRKKIEHVLFLVSSKNDNTVIIDFSCDLPKKKLKQFVKWVRKNRIKNGEINF